MRCMRVQDFDFELPSELIAQYPLEQRSASRLLCLSSISKDLQDRGFRELPSLLRENDVIVLNNTQVMKARLHGVKDTGGQVEILVERVMNDHEIRAQISASNPPKIGSTIFVGDRIPLKIISREGEFWRLRLECSETAFDVLKRHGKMPLPPYIDRDAVASDNERYQTIYAQHLGAVAAPTAGLHFDRAILNDLVKLGVKLAYITLHVGAGTFQPLRVDDISQHRMHSECYHIPEETVELINAAKRRGGRVTAVGTTSLRALESAASSGDLRAGKGETALFITPGYQFRIVERLLTNFHLPRSTLLMLVSAFAGMEPIRAAYQHAIAQRYRFFSYGDAMLIDRERR
jgi:S-adenosylmethionine:tRNA ribosyltransferase-isomerase